MTSKKKTLKRVILVVIAIFLASTILISLPMPQVGEPQNEQQPNIDYVIDPQDLGDNLEISDDSIVAEDTTLLSGETEEELGEIISEEDLADREEVILGDLPSNIIGEEGGKALDNASSLDDDEVVSDTTDDLDPSLLDSDF